MPNYSPKFLIINNKKSIVNQNLIKFGSQNISRNQSEDTIYRDLEILIEFSKDILKIKKLNPETINSLPNTFSRVDFFILIHKYIKNLSSIGYSPNMISFCIPSLKRLFLYLYPIQGVLSNIYAIKRHDWIIQGEDKDKLIYTLNQGLNYSQEELLVKIAIQLVWEIYLPVKHITNLKLIKLHPLEILFESNVNGSKVSIPLKLPSNHSLTKLYYQYRQIITDIPKESIFPENISEQGLRYYLKSYLNKYNIEDITLKQIQNIRLETFLFNKNSLYLH